MFMLFDPLYIVLTLPALVAMIAAQAYVSYEFGKWRKVPAGMSGKEVAEEIIRRNGLDVGVEATTGWLSDHYDPRTKVVRLSPEVYNGRTVSAISVAAHETGHAIQHRAGYLFLKVRTALVPIISISSQAGWLFLFIGLIFRSFNLALAGLVFFSGGLLFSLITLPVEFDASRRGLEELKKMGMYREGSKQMLVAAGLTYVASFFSALMEFLYYFLLVMGMRRKD